MRESGDKWELQQKGVNKKGVGHSWERWQESAGTKSENADKKRRQQEMRRTTRKGGDKTCEGNNMIPNQGIFQGEGLYHGGVLYKGLYGIGNSIYLYVNG